MKRLLIGGLAVGSMLFAATGVATADTGTPAPVPTAIGLDATSGATVTGGSWPTAGAVAGGGRLLIQFATPDPAQEISGYAVTCKAPTKDTATPPNVVALPSLVATFAVDPTDGSSSDPDYDNDGLTTSLKVGPYVVTGSQLLPPLTCSMITTNARGASKPGKSAKPAALAASTNCANSEAANPGGLEVLMGAGAIGVLGQKAPEAPHPFGTPVGTPVTAVGKQTASNFDVVTATVGSNTGVFCTTGTDYGLKLLSDQPLSFSPTVSQIPAKIGSGAHPAQLKFSAFGLTAAVASSVSLTVNAGSSSIFAYDASKFTLVSCPDVAGKATCAIGSPAPGFFTVTQTTNVVLSPGKPITSTPVTLTFQKIGTPVGDLKISLVAASTVISVGAAPPVPVALSDSPTFINGLNNSFVDLGSPPGTCNSSTGPPSATCAPYSVFAANPGNPFHAAIVATGGAHSPPYYGPLYGSSQPAPAAAALGLSSLF